MFLINALDKKKLTWVFFCDAGTPLAKFMDLRI